MTEAEFGPGVLRLALGPSVRPDAAVVDGEDDTEIEDGYKAAYHAFVKAGKRIAIFAPKSALGARVALYVIGGELARGGSVDEAVFILPDRAVLDAWSRELRALRS